MYDDFGYSDYAALKKLAATAIVNYRANLEYSLDNLQYGENEEDMRNELKTALTNSLLASLPSQVSEALDEIG